MREFDYSVFVATCLILIMAISGNAAFAGIALVIALRSGYIWSRMKAQPVFSKLDQAPRLQL